MARQIAAKHGAVSSGVVYTGEPPNFHEIGGFWRLCFTKCKGAFGYPRKLPVLSQQRQVEARHEAFLGSAAKQGGDCRVSVFAQIGSKLIDVEIDMLLSYIG